MAKTSLDPLAQTATILPSESEGIISFAKGERNYKQKQNFYEQKAKEAKNARIAKSQEGALENLSEVNGDPWATDREYADIAKNQFYDKYADQIPAILEANGGIIPIETQRQIIKDKQILEQMISLSEEQQKSYKSMESLMKNPDFQTTENAKKIRYYKDPIAHATETGNEAEYEKLGPVGYREKYLGGMLEPKINLMEYFGKHFESDLKSNLEVKKDVKHINSKGGYSEVQTEVLDLEKTKDYILEKMTLSTDLYDRVNRTAMSDAGENWASMDDEQKRIARENVVDKLANQYAYKERVLKQSTKANPEDKSSFTMRYVTSGKGGKAKLTDEGRAAITPQKILFGKDEKGEAIREVNSVGAIAVKPGIARATGDIFSSTEYKKLDKPVKVKGTDKLQYYQPIKINKTGNILLKEGHVFLSDNGDVLWKGIGEIGGKDKDVYLDATTISSDEVKGAVAALEALKNELTEGLQDLPDQ